MPSFVALTVKVTSSFTVASVPSAKVLPSVAMRIFAPSVLQENVTVVPLSTLPAAGVAVGGATCSVAASSFQKFSVWPAMFACRDV